MIYLNKYILLFIIIIIIMIKLPQDTQWPYWAVVGIIVFGGNSWGTTTRDD